MRRLILLVVLAALVAALLPSAASARVTAGRAIVPGRSIGHATLLTSRTKLERRLGPGLKVRSARTDFGRLITYRYPSRKIDVTYRSGTAVIVFTKDPRYRTRKGAGVGVTRARLKQLYSTSLTCDTPTLCSLGALRPGAHVTSFRLAKKSTKVVNVLVGIVLD